MISVYSVLSAVLYFNLALALVFILRRSRRFLVHYSVTVLVLLAVLSLVRLLVPIHLPSPLVLRSQTVLPAIERFLSLRLLPGDSRATPGAILLVLWAAGAGFFAVREARAILRARQTMRAYRTQDAPEVQRIALENGVRAHVLVTPDAAVPYAAGLFRPRIILPSGIPEEELPYILLHEAQHIRGRDAWIKLFFIGIRALFWFNPLVHLFFRDLDALLEMRCDAAVTEGMDDARKMRYLSAILAFSERLVPQGAASALSGAPNALRQRFDLLLTLKKRRSGQAQAAICLAALALFLASYTVVVQPYVRPEGLSLFETHSYIVRTHRDRYVLYLGGISTGYELTREQLSEPPFSRMTILEDRFHTQEAPPEQIAESEETGWYFRQMDGKLEMRLWSFTYRIWRSDWQAVGDSFTP